MTDRKIQGVLFRGIHLEGNHVDFRRVSPEVHVDMTGGGFWPVTFFCLPRYKLVEPIHLKNMLVIRQIGSFPPGSGWNLKKYVSCHHLVRVMFKKTSLPKKGTCIAKTWYWSTLIWSKRKCWWKTIATIDRPHKPDESLIWCGVNANFRWEANKSKTNCENSFKVTW